MSGLCLATSCERLVGRAAQGFWDANGANTKMFCGQFVTANSHDDRRPSVLAAAVLLIGLNRAA